MSDSTARPPKVTVPIIKGRLADNVHFSVIQEYGTAFYMGNNLFMTAGHCLVFPPEPDFLYISLPSEQAHQNFGTNLRGFRIIEGERHQHFDIGIAKVAENISHYFPELLRLRWSFVSLPCLCDVATHGYPHALSPQQDFNALTGRGHKGYIVAELPHRVDGFDTHFLSYEVSFQVPLGLSGAPLLYGSPSTVGGVLIGTKETSMILRVEKEITREGTQVEVYQREQIVHYGVAVPSAVIGGIQSALLGMSVTDYLIKEGLVV